MDANELSFHPIMWAPINWEMGFLESELDPVAAKLFAWKKEIYQGHACTVESKEIGGDIHPAISKLLHLLAVGYNRELISKTQSSWVSYLNNHSFPGSSSILIEKKGKLPANVSEISLSGVQKTLGIEGLPQCSG